MNIKKYMKPSYGVAIVAGLLLAGTAIGATVISFIYSAKNKVLGA